MGECASLGDAASPPMGVGEVDPQLPPARPASIPAMSQPLPWLTEPTSPVTVSAKPASIPAVSQPLLTKPTSPATVSAKPSLPAHSQPPVQPLPQAPLAPVAKTLTQKGKLLTRQHPMPAADMELLRWGSWPLPCPGLRDCTMRSTTIELPAVSLRCFSAKFRPSGSGCCPCRMNTRGVSPRIHQQPSWRTIASWPCQAPHPRARDRFPGPVGPSMVLWGTHSLDIRQTTLTWCRCRPAAASGLPTAVPSWRRSMLPYFRHQELEAPEYDPCKPAMWVTTSCPLVMPGWVERWLHGGSVHFVSLGWTCHAVATSCPLVRPGWVEVTAWWLPILSISEFTLLNECIFVILCNTGIVPVSALLELQHWCSTLVLGQ